MTRDFFCNYFFLIFRRFSQNCEKRLKIARSEYQLDVRESVHRDTIMKVTNKMQLYRFIYYS
jgi:hypothetical protein